MLLQRPHQQHILFLSSIGENNPASPWATLHRKGRTWFQWLTCLFENSILSMFDWWKIHPSFWNYNHPPNFCNYDKRRRLWKLDRDGRISRLPFKQSFKQTVQVRIPDSLHRTVSHNTCSKRLLKIEFDVLRDRFLCRFARNQIIEQLLVQHYLSTTARKTRFCQIFNSCLSFYAVMGVWSRNKQAHKWRPLASFARLRCLQEHLKLILMWYLQTMGVTLSFRWQGFRGGSCLEFQQIEVEGLRVNTNFIDQTKYEHITTEWSTKNRNFSSDIHTLQERWKWHAFRFVQKCHYHTHSSLENDRVETAQW